MTFDENYGELPMTLMRLIRTNNVSPADFFFMTDVLFPYPKSEQDLWNVLAEHIVSYSETGVYRLPLGMVE
jgi:hypothetical protein